MPIGKPVAGVATGTLAIGEVLTVTAEAGGSGRVVVFGGATPSASFVARDVADGAAVTFGPFIEPRFVRVYTPTGNVRAATALTVPAVTPLEPAVISDDRMTISGRGAVPDSKVSVFDQDTGLALGTQPVADVIGEWSLRLSAPLPEDARVGYAVLVFGPYAAVVAPLLGHLDFSRSDNSALLAVLL